MAGNKPEGAGIRGCDLNTQTLETAASAQAFAFPTRWRPIRPLGRGGQAEVWLALDRKVDQMVAIKVFGSDLSPDAIRRFRREVLLGRTLEHSHLVRIFDLIEAGDHLAIAMEWCPHGSLADAQGSQPFSLPDVISIAEQVLDVLAYLHAQGVVHRDIKPSNMLVGSDGMVHLGDLGLARQFAGEDDRTRTRAAVGTPTYMSPEQILGHDPGPPSDLYSLGVALFQLLAGRPPFDGSSDFETADRQLHTRAPNPEQFAETVPAGWRGSSSASWKSRRGTDGPTRGSRWPPFAVGVCWRRPVCCDAPQSSPPHSRLLSEHSLHWRHGWQSSAHHESQGFSPRVGMCELSMDGERSFGTMPAGPRFGRLFALIFAKEKVAKLLSSRRQRWVGPYA